MVMMKVILNSPAVMTNRPPRSILHLGQSSVFPSGAPQSVSSVISYNILLFRGTPQQLEELFVAALGGKPGAENLLSLWLCDELRTALLGSTPAHPANKSRRQTALTGCSLDMVCLALCIVKRTDTYEGVFEADFTPSSWVPVLMCVVSHSPLNANHLLRTDG